jgi:NhaA family Na+:H+ antiporter
VCREVWSAILLPTPPEAVVPGTPLFIHATRREARRIADVLRTETTGGLLLLGAAAIALVWANSPWRTAYGVREARGTEGPASLLGRLGG